MSAPPREHPHNGGRRRAWWIAGGIVLAVAIAAAIAIPLSLRPRTMSVVRRDVFATVTSEGPVGMPPSARVDIHTTTRAPVEYVDVSVGERVSRGDVLVEFSYPSTEQAHQEAAARLEAIEQEYVQAKQQYASQVDQARQQLADAQAEVRLARQAVAQAPPPAPAPEAPPESGTSGTAWLPPAGLGGARLIQEETPPEGTPVDLNQALADEQRAQASLAQAKEDEAQGLLNYQQQINEAQAALSRADAGEKAAQVTAPIAGTVTVLNAQPGQPVQASANQPAGRPALLATIVNLQALQVHAPVSASEASLLRTGMPAALTFREVPNEHFQGQVQRIVTQALPGGSGYQYLALVGFDNPHGTVRPDMTGDVSIQVGRVHNVLAVPNKAVHTDQAGQPYVKVREDGKWQARRVETGLHGNEYTQIESGLHEGELIQVPRA